MSAVRVTRNRYGKPSQPWLVVCVLCGGNGDDSSFFGQLCAALGSGVKGWAPDWRTAQDYAQRHAAKHEQTRCPTCSHVPTGDPSTSPGLGE